MFLHLRGKFRRGDAGKNYPSRKLWDNAMSQWHYEKDGNQQGPVSLQQLKQLAASGELQPTDLQPLLTS